ncbi:unnamed protein product [Gongylonema pulchrum]|uniref:Transmembrane protein n=1 Tax=Gongylonema pulchrum TaxID=637853 RepID=A0A183E0C4_9BILA|nr:unnamed protein product [Gongylonema pulchrum]
MVAGGDNRTDITNKTIKVASPRFLSIVPDEENKDRVSLLILCSRCMSTFLTISGCIFV